MAASIKSAIKWIAENDETAEMDEDVIASLISVMLVADLFGKTPDYIASKVIRERNK